MQKIKLRAFTLVELIVVITILAFLGTIGYISFIGYQQSARDSARISDISLIERQLSYNYAITNTYPTPDESTTITASGITVGHQGKIGSSVLSTLRQSGEIKDPFDNEEYTYFINDTASDYQIYSLMEKAQSALAVDLGINSSYAEFKGADERYPKLFGDALGIITDESNIPINTLTGISTLDIVNHAGPSYVAHFTSTRSITGTGEVLRNIIPNANCTRIKEMGGMDSKVYTLNPELLGNFEGYCDMGIDEDGWLLVARTHEDSSADFDFGWLNSSGLLEDDSSAYSLGQNIQNIYFNKILFGTYEEEKNITAAITWDIDYDFFKQGIVNPEENLSDQNDETANCVLLFDNIGYDENCFRGGRLDRPSLAFWGAFGKNTHYVFNRQNSSDEGFIFADGFKTTNNSLDNESGGIDNFRREQGMLFVK